MANPAKSAELLLLLGLVTGLGMAALGLRLQSTALPEGVAAQVGNSRISMADWQRAVAIVASERRSALTVADQQVILERLVDEELLVQQGLALGLVERDRRLRGELVQQVMAMASAEAAAVDEAEAEAYYRQHPEWFSPPAMLRVQAVQVSPLPGEQPAQTAARAAQLRARMAAGERLPASAGLRLPPLPDVLLPPAKLVGYLGPAAVQTLTSLAPGDTAAALPNGDGFWLLRLVARSAPAPRPYAELRSAVIGELKRRKDENAVRSLLADLRQQQTVLVRPAAQ